MCANESSVSKPHTPSDSSAVLLPGMTMVLYGIVAAGGAIAVLNGSVNYLEFSAGGVPDPLLSLLGIVVTLGIGFTFVCLALAGAVAIGIDHANRA